MLSMTDRAFDIDTHGTYTIDEMTARPTRSELEMSLIDMMSECHDSKIWREPRKYRAATLAAMEEMEQQAIAGIRFNDLLNTLTRPLPVNLIRKKTKSTLTENQRDARRMRNRAQRQARKKNR